MTGYYSDIKGKSEKELREDGTKVIWTTFQVMVNEDCGDRIEMGTVASVSIYEGRYTANITLESITYNIDSKREYSNGILQFCRSYASLNEAKAVLAGFRSE